MPPKNLSDIAFFKTIKKAVSQNDYIRTIHSAARTLHPPCLSLHPNPHHSIPMFSRTLE